MIISSNARHAELVSTFNFTDETYESFETNLKAKWLKLKRHKAKEVKRQEALALEE